MNLEFQRKAAAESKAEVTAMWISFAATTIFALLGTAVAIICDSLVLLLDALYGLAQVVICLIAIIVVRKLHAPHDEKYNFGYAKYEPLMTAAQGVLIATICSATIIVSAQDLLNPAPISFIGMAIGYAFLDLFVSFGTFLYLRKVGRKLKSRVILADSAIWLIEAVILLAVSAAFIFEAVVIRTKWNFIAPYIDPVLCIILSVSVVYKPVSIIGESFRDLVDARPGKTIIKKVYKHLNDWKDKYKLGNIKWVKARKAGRHIFVTVCYLSDRSPRELTVVRDQICEEALTVVPSMDVYVLFSCE